MKSLYLTGGAMGVGKTTTCQHLKKTLPNAVLLDGDWCWDATPSRITDETKQMVIDNICYLLNNFIHCSAYENIVFCWVVHEQRIIDTIAARLDTRHCRIKAVSLICTETCLKERLDRDIHRGVRSGDVIKRSLARLPQYTLLSTQKIDTSQCSAETAAALIARL